MVELQPVVEVGAGMRLFMRVTAFGSITQAGLDEIGVNWFPGHVNRLLPFPAGPLDGQSGKAERSKKTSTPLGANGQTSLKFPFRSANEGTAWLNSCGVFSRRNSSEKKK